MSKEIFEQLKLLNAKQDAIVARLQPIEEKLAALTGLPVRVDQVESDVSELRDRLSKLETTVEGATASLKGPSKRTEMEAIKKISKEVYSVNIMKEMASKQVIMSGLIFDEQTDIRRLVHSVAAALDSSILLRDIVSIRKMFTRSTGSGKSTVTDVAAAAGAAATMVADAGATEGTKRCPNILVTFSSNSIVRSVMSSKIKKGKLWLLDIDAEVLRSACAPAAQNYLINVNEYLPRDLHRLRSSAFYAAKKYGYICFVRNGKIYIRTKDEGRAVIIKCDKDLNDFLDRATNI